jgi:signal transduction histidine kinase
MLIYRKSSTLRYGISILSFLAALALRIVGRPLLGNDSPFLFFFSALALASWYGGLFPGILAALLGAIAAGILFLPPITPEGNFDINHLFQICVFLATGTFVSILMKKLHNAVERSEKVEQELEGRVQERTAQLDQANRELEAEKNTLLGILDQMPEAVYIVNPEYRIEYTNPSMEREFGPIDSQKCYQYLNGTQADVCPWCRNHEVFDGKNFAWEWNSPKNNKVYDCYDAPIVLQNGTGCKLKIMHDITDLKKAEAELTLKHQQIQRLSSELLTAQETERMRISRELHDELGQSLTLIKLKIGLLEMDLPETSPSLKKLCADASEHVDQAIENTRRLSRALSPVTLETLGLTIALRRLAEDFDKSSSVRIAADIDNIDNLLPKKFNILLFRIFQEGLNNIIKHSGASEANILLKKSEDGIRFDIRDNGKGWDFEKNSRPDSKSKEGLGIIIMRERVRTLGGDLIIESRKNAGTRLHFKIQTGKKEIDNGELSSDFSG